MTDEDWRFRCFFVKTFMICDVNLTTRKHYSEKIPQFVPAMIPPGLSVSLPNIKKDGFKQISQNKTA